MTELNRSLAPTQEMLPEKLRDRWRVENWAGRSYHSLAIQVRRNSDGFLGVFKTPLQPVEPKRLERFKREVTSLAKINHPNVAEIEETGETESGIPFYITMRGTTLGEYWRSFVTSATVNDAFKHSLEIVKGIAEGLGACHKAGVIHRDVKQQNIIIIGGVPKLIDLGIAYLQGEDRLTLTDEKMGNKANRIPEAFYQMVEDVQPWWDFRSLVHVWIWMLTPSHLADYTQWDIKYHKFFEGLGWHGDCVRAIWASCELEGCRPNSAESLLGLIGELFRPLELPTTAPDDIRKAAEARAGRLALERAQVLARHKHKQDLIVAIAPRLAPVMKSLFEIADEKKANGLDLEIRPVQEQKRATRSDPNKIQECLKAIGDGGALDALLINCGDSNHTITVRFKFDVVDNANINLQIILIQHYTSTVVEISFGISDGPNWEVIRNSALVGGKTRVTSAEVLGVFSGMLTSTKMWGS